MRRIGTLTYMRLARARVRCGLLCVGTRMDPSKNTRKLINAWVRHPRRGGQPQHNLRHSYRKALVAIGEIHEDDVQAPFKKWVDSIENLPEGSWRTDVRKRLRKWNASNDEEKANERAKRKRQ